MAVIKIGFKKEKQSRDQNSQSRVESQIDSQSDSKDFCDIVQKKFQSDAKEQPLNLKLGQHIIGSGGTSNTGTVYTLGQ